MLVGDRLVPVELAPEGDPLERPGKSTLQKVPGTDLRIYALRALRWRRTPTVLQQRRNLNPSPGAPRPVASSSSTPSRDFPRTSASSVTFTPNRSTPTIPMNSRIFTILGARPFPAKTSMSTYRCSQQIGSSVAPLYQLPKGAPLGTARHRYCVVARLGRYAHGLLVHRMSWLFGEQRGFQGAGRRHKSAKRCLVPSWGR